MKYFFKRHITIFKTKSKICIYQKESNNNIEIDYNSNNYSLIETILQQGVLKKDIETNKFLKKLHVNGFLGESDYFQNEKNQIRRGFLFLEYLYDDFDFVDLQKKLLKPILVFGAGGAGSSLIYLLAQYGFSNIHIVDFDIVQESDIYRTTTFFKKDINNSKIEILKSRIEENFNINIKTYKGAYSTKVEINELIEEVRPSFVVNACDPKLSFRLDLNKVCFQKEIPFILISYSYENINIGPIYVPNITSCENSFNDAVKFHHGEDQGFEYLEKMFKDYLIHPSISFNINTLASLAFKEILFFLIEKFDNCQTIGRRIVFNPLTFNISSKIAKCDDNCAICK